MIYLLFWLLFGLAGYITALAIRINKLESHSNSKRESCTTSDYVTGLTGILFGPLILVLVLILHKKGDI
jgi:hypothetical protein